MDQYSHFRSRPGSPLRWWVPPLLGDDKPNLLMGQYPHFRSLLGSPLHWWVPSPLRDDVPNLMMGQYPNFMSVSGSPLRWWVPSPLEDDGLNLIMVLPPLKALSSSSFRWYDYLHSEITVNPTLLLRFSLLGSKSLQVPLMGSPTRKQQCKLTYTPFPTNNTRDKDQHSEKAWYHISPKSLR